MLQLDVVHETGPAEDETDRITDSVSRALYRWKRHKGIERDAFMGEDRKESKGDGR